MTELPRWFAAALLLGAMLTQSAQAQIYTSIWDDDDHSHLWSHTANWAPDTLPFGTVAIGQYDFTANAVALLDVNYGSPIFPFPPIINQLVISRGSDFFNSPNGGATSFLLEVGGATVISSAHGSGSSITLFGNGLDTENIQIEAGGTLNLNSQTAAGTAILRLGVENSFIHSGGTIFGNGRIELNGVPEFFEGLGNFGTLSAGAFGFNPPPTELHITGDDPNAGLSLDGNGSGVVNVFSKATLRVDVPDVYPFGGDLNLFSGSTLHISMPWTIDGGTVDVNTPTSGFPFPTPGAPAHLAGAAITYSGGTLTLDDAGDSLVLDAPFTATGGAINNSGTIIFNAAATFQAGADFNMIGNDCKLVVNQAVNINRPDFDLDGAETGGNVTTINAGGVLGLNLGAGADEDFGHTINLNGGDLKVTTLDDSWSLGTGATINASGPTPSTVKGGTLQVLGSADVNVATGSELYFDQSVQILGKADVSIGAGAVLDFSTVTYGHGAATYAGAGTLRSGNATVNQATTWDVATVDLDDGAVTLNASLTINANSIDVVGNSFDAAIVINNAGKLTVNLAGGGGWTVGPGGTITYHGDILTTNVFLAGSPVALNGTINNNGYGQIDAQLHISASGRVNMNVGSLLRLNGGNNTTSPNTIAGGIIDGGGLLFIVADCELRGFGTINPTVAIAGALLADNGVLNVQEVSLGGAVGTADLDGILNVINPWNVNASGRVELRGGELRGAEVNNNGPSGINGHGLVSAKVINNTRIDAEKADTLLLNNPANDNDWDGTTGSGQLKADGANLELRDNSSFLFTGTVDARNGNSVFANGFELEFEPSSTLKLTAGKYRSSHSTRFGGNATVFAGGASTLEIMGGTATFENGSMTTLHDDLLLETGLTTIQAGAQFPSVVLGASLIASTGTLRLLDAADLDSAVENRSTMDLGAAGTAGQVAAYQFLQTASGFLAMEIGGTGPNDYDRLDIDTTASLAGILFLSRINGYVPVLGHTFDILSAPGGVSGTFGTVLGTTLPSGLKFDVIYRPQSVQLKVVSTSMFSADFDHDSDVDGADLAIWRGAFRVTNLADADGDNDSDGADFLAWQRQLGSGTATPAASADFDHDLDVDGADLEVWRGAFAINNLADADGDNDSDGADFLAWQRRLGGAPSGALATAVPEPPTTLVLISMGLAIFARRVRGRRAWSHKLVRF